MLSLPPEMYDLIASHLPIHHRAPTLLALALTTPQLYERVQPLLYPKVIIRTEEDAYTVLRRMLDDERLGRLVRELHIMTDLSVATRKSDKGATMLTDLRDVIKAGRLPNIYALRVVFPSGWFNDKDIEDLEGYCNLPLEFWEDLKRECPRLRELFLEGIGDINDAPWMDESGLFELNGLSHLSSLGLKFEPDFPRRRGAVKLLKSLSNLASTLQALTLYLDDGYQDATPLLSLTFPHLKSLELGSFDSRKTELAMDFWARPPGLEKLFLDEAWGSWFAEAVAPGLIPSLTHLKANFSEVRAMASHLPQLRFLSVAYSLNGQVPYLLRSVLPNGLPDLKSLEINQTPYAVRNIGDHEGVMWYETESGEFRNETRTSNAARTMMDDYMYSIVRGAPNIEELCLQGFPLHFGEIERLAPVLAHLPCLERMYYPAFANSPRKISQSDIDGFISDCRRLADVCPSLYSVTDVSSSDLPYLKGRVTRNHRGLVEKIIPAQGFGMHFLGGDDDPFPKNSMPFY